MIQRYSTRRTCINGHHYNKSSDCPVCPVCAAEDKPTSGWQSGLSAPARRALQSIHVTTEEDLAQYRESEILALHGIGPGSIPGLVKALAAKGLRFKDSVNQ